jgi:hypothetical protein
MNYYKNVFYKSYTIVKVRNITTNNFYKTHFYK